MITTEERATTRAASELMRTEVTRRVALTVAAWSVPVIAVACSAPASTASTVDVTCGFGPNDNGTFIISSGILTILYRVRPDIGDVNVEYTDGTSQNFHDFPIPASLTVVLPLRGVPTWVQVHGFDTHYGQECK